MKVFNFGSINIDHVYRVPHLVRPGETLSSLSLDTVLGGKGANQSVALARAGANVCHIGRIGDGDEWAREMLLASGVDVSLVKQVSGASGHAIIQVDDKGENSIVLHGGANQSFDKGILKRCLESAAPGDWLLIQNECNCVPEALEIALANDMHIAFNPAPMTPSVKKLPLERCAIVIVNETEAMALADTDDPGLALEILARRCPDTCLVLTLGSQGAMLRRGDKILEEAAVPVDVVDTTGAGDTFVGYFLAASSQAQEDRSALHRAITAAALSVTRAGASSSIPLSAEVDVKLGQLADLSRI